MLNGGGANSRFVLASDSGMESAAGREGPMTTATIETTESPFSPRALELLQASYLRTKPPVSAQKLWDEVLTPADRTRLGGDFCEAFRTYDGTV